MIFVLYYVVIISYKMSTEYSMILISEDQLLQ